MEVLDLCMGSGQVSRAAIRQVGASGRVIGLDASLGMLIAARAHVEVPQVQAYVERLPIADASFDALTMGYALRHVADLVDTFREYLRVLRPGGRVLIIEFTKPSRPLTAGLLKLYLKHVVPGFARIAGRDASRMMRYFWDTIDACVPPETIVDSLAAAGFAEPQRGGEFELFAEYTATRPR
jgi:demethylmenaquinone methyltransferase/2-methoxy-6-polyprenyl-1,4-benzoquinol methylase